MNRDDDDDDRRRCAWLTLPCCCIGLGFIGALIWLIILTVRIDHANDRLNLLISECNGVCTTGTAVSTSGAVASGRHGVKPLAHVTKKTRNALPEQVVKVPKIKKQPRTPADVAVPIDASAPPRWARVGDAKKPPAGQGVQ